MLIIWWWNDATADVENIDPSDLGLPYQGQWEWSIPDDGGSGEWVWLDALGWEWSVQDPGLAGFPQLGFFPPEDHPLHPINLPENIYDSMFPSWVYPGDPGHPNANIDWLIDNDLAPAWLNNLPSGYTPVFMFQPGQPIRIDVLGPDSTMVYSLPWHGAFNATDIIDNVYDMYLGALGGGYGEMSFAQFVQAWFQSEYNQQILAWGFDAAGANVNPNATDGLPPIELPDGSTWHPNDQGGGDGSDGPDGPDGPDGDGPDTDGPDGDGPGGDGDGPKPKTPPKFGTSPGSSKPNFVVGPDGNIRLLPKVVKSILTP